MWGDFPINGRRGRGWALAAILMLGSHFAPSVSAQVAVIAAPTTVADTDGLPGENVILDGSGSQPLEEQDELDFHRWYNAQGQQIANGERPTVRLPDGANTITLTVGHIFSGEGVFVATDSTTVTITVTAAVAPVANAGTSRTIADTDGAPGELVTLDGSASTDADGQIVAYEWYRDGTTLLGSSTTPVLDDVPLPDGDNQITLIVRDNVGRTGSATIVLTVGSSESQPQPEFADLNLRPNERELARKLDNLCTRLSQAEMALTPEQIDLRDRCQRIIADEDPAAQAHALEQLGAEEINAMRTQSLLFSQSQNDTILNRLTALRAGEKGVSLAGLNLKVGDKYLPIEQIAKSLDELLGGGASGDEPGGLFGNRLGLWMRGNYAIGEKARSAVDGGFESDQWGLTAGVDYRFTASSVLGLSLGYGRAALDFKPVGNGNLETAALTASLYGSAYLGNVYLDGVVNYGDTDFDSTRHIVYTESGTLISRSARGDTSGQSLSAGFALGYDFVFGALTIAPSVGYFFVDTDIDPFTERGAGGLNLAYAEQNYESSTGTAGLRITYALKALGGVIIPHLRATYVREFKEATEVFAVRFANDPFASSGDPTPPIIVQTNEPDRSYLKLALGVSAQFPYDISGYAEYQRLEGFDLVEFHDLTVGLRIQRSFR